MSRKTFPKTCWSRYGLPENKLLLRLETSVLIFWKSSDYYFYMLSMRAGVRLIKILTLLKKRLLDLKTKSNWHHCSSGPRMHDSVMTTIKIIIRKQTGGTD